MRKPKKSKNPDLKDLNYTLKGRGDMHALDRIDKYTSRKPRKKKPGLIGTVKAGKTILELSILGGLLPVWEDRNRANQGTKLNP